MTLFPISKNQPIDYATLEAMINKINDIDTKVNLKSGNSQFKNTSVRTSDMVLAANNINITGTASDAEWKTFSWSMGSNDVAFKSPPIVTATVSRNANASIDGAYVSITSVSNDRAEGKIFFPKGGTFDIDINLIAVGLSNLDKL
jgi:hypothetical protein